MDVEFVTFYAVAQQMLDDLHRARRQTACASEAVELERKLRIIIVRVNRTADNLDEEARLRQAVRAFLVIMKATARLLRQAAAWILRRVLYTDIGHLRDGDHAVILPDTQARPLAHRDDDDIGVEYHGPLDQLAAA